VRGVTIHDIRATAATRAQAEGLPAQALMGHKSARTTEIYLRDKAVPVVRGPKKA
jgi:integrase